MPVLTSCINISFGGIYLEYPLPSLKYILPSLLWWLYAPSLFALSRQHLVLLLFQKPGRLAFQHYIDCPISFLLSALQKFQNEANN
jgi:hypothetical protein